MLCQMLSCEIEPHVHTKIAMQKTASRTGSEAIREYSEQGRGEGGHPWTIRGWSRLLWHPHIL